MADNNILYSKKDYWDQRYGSISNNDDDQTMNDNKTFDWFNKTWKDLKPSLSKYISAKKKILHLGCGNSVLSEEMYNDGFHDQVGVFLQLLNNYLT